MVVAEQLQGPAVSAAAPLPYMRFRMRDKLQYWKQIGAWVYNDLRMRMRMSFNILIPKVTFTSGAEWKPAGWRCWASW